MLNDKQSLILCGVLASGIFASGLLGILDNFIVQSILTIIFIVIVINIYFTISASQSSHIEEVESDE